MAQNAIIQGFDKVAEIITIQQFGFFTLWNSLKSQRFADFPRENTENANAGRSCLPVELVNGLKQILDTLGEGDFYIEFKTNSKANTTGVFNYYFTTLEKPEMQASQPQTGFNGFGAEFYQSQFGIIQNTQNQVYEAQRKLDKLEHDFELKKLRMEMKGTKRKDNTALAIEKFAGLGTVLAIGIMGKVAPESLPVIKQALEAITGAMDSETDEYEEETETLE